MQFPSISLLALMATLTYAQTIQQELAKIPACGVTCLATAATAAGCGATDFNCQCGSGREAITRSAIPCVAISCQGSDLTAITSASTEICRLNALAAITGSGTSTSASSSATGIAGIINTSVLSGSTTGTATSAVKSGTQSVTAATGSSTGNAGSAVRFNFGAGVVVFGAVVGAFAL